MTSRVCKVWGNLKMHPVSEVLSAYQALIAADKDGMFDHFGLVVPYPYLQQASELFNGSIGIAAQSISEHESGAFSSQVSGEILQDIGLQTVMIGHSEVRQLGVNVGAQLKVAQKLGMHVIYCIGEGVEAYESGRKEQVITEQLSVLESLDRVTIAYEPIWSIGTGNAASVSDINEALLMVRACLDRSFSGNFPETPVLYGGSINHNNCLEVFTQTEVNGFLVGGVSLKPKQILEVIRLCS